MVISAQSAPAMTLDDIYQLDNISVMLLDSRYMGAVNLDQYVIGDGAVQTRGLEYMIVLSADAHNVNISVLEDDICTAIDDITPRPHVMMQSRDRNNRTVIYCVPDNDSADSYTRLLILSVEPAELNLIDIHGGISISHH